MDRITLRNIRAMGRHGVRAEERANPQPFGVELTIEVDADLASRSDDMNDTVNYAQLHALIVEIVTSRSFALLERLAAEIVQTIFDDKRIARAEVTIAKPGILDGATPSVTLVRDNPNFGARG